MPPSLALLLAYLTALLPALCRAQTYSVSGSFQAAVWATNGGQDLSSAASVQCPDGYPQSCSTIGEPDYCCPSGNQCQMASNGVPGCCPHGQSCSGSIGGSGGYKPTSWYQPSPTTQYFAGGGAATTVYQPTTEYAQQTTQNYVNQGFCTTIIANGPDLPTTANADCGTALVVSGARALGRGWAKWIGTVGGLQVMGALLLWMR